MKRCFAALLVAVLLVGALIPVGAMAATQYATVVGGWLRLRAYASFNADTINSYYTGTSVKVLDVTGNWYHVETPDGNVGYMYGDYLRTGSTPTPSGETNATVVSANGYGVRMRSGPGTGYRILRKFSVGTRAQILESGSYWSRIRVDSLTGYMMNQFLNRDGYVPPVYDGDATVWSANGYGVRLRTGPGTGYGKIGVYSVGTRVRILEKGYVWDKVQIGSRVGYMMNQFLIYNDNYEVTGVTINNYAPVVGNTLALQTLTPSSATVSYNWLVNGVSKGTSASYLVTAADKGATIRLQVTGLGSYSGSVYSPLTAAVTDTGVVTAVTLNNMNPQVGNVLKIATLTPASADITYTWKVDGVQAGIGTTYQAQAADVNKSIELVVTGYGSYSGQASSGKTATVRLAEAPVITTTSLTAATYGKAYSQQLTATGGNSITWSLATGSNPLPTGLTLTADGLISGTPTVTNTAGVTVTVQASNGIGTAATKDLSLVVKQAVVTIADIPSVTVPVSGGANATNITNEQYAGAVVWTPALGSDNKFAAGTEYQATITLTPTANYTLSGVAADFFKVAGVESYVAKNAANKGVLTVKFPKTAGTATTVTSVTVAPATASVAKGGSQTFTATVAGTGSFAQTVDWTVNGGITGTAISNAGVLTVAAGETATSLTVTATSTMDATKVGTATVTVTAAP